MVFLLVEKAVRNLKGEDHHGHTHSHGSTPKASAEKEDDKNKKAKRKDATKSEEKSEKEQIDEVKKCDDKPDGILIVIFFFRPIVILNKQIKKILFSKMKLK